MPGDAGPIPNMGKKQALQGVRVLDFTWAITGPLATKCLSDFGATVVKIESSSKVDLLRSGPPYYHGEPSVDTAIHFILYSTSKYGVALDIRHPKGIDVVKRLVKWADVVVENFMPKTLEGWGLGYEDLRRINEDIISVRASVHGQEGPWAQSVSFGPILTGLAGFYSVLGWPDRPPVTTGGPYTDFVAPWFVAAATLDALAYRRATGKGMQIDLSQTEAAVSFLTPAILDFNLNGRLQGPEGNRCPVAAPHGAYRCRGDDRWCVVAVSKDEHWAGFLSALGKPEWSGSVRFASLQARKENEDELDRLVETWTSGLVAEDVMNILQSAGVPAGVVQNGKDLLSDPQLSHRGFFARLDHQKIGPEALHEAPSFRLSATPFQLRAAPALGQDTERVCTEILGMSSEEFVSLLNEGVFR